MSKNETRDPINNPDYNMPAHEYADKHLLSIVSDAIAKKCDAFIFIYISKDPKQKTDHVDRCHQGDTGQLIFLCEYLKHHIFNETLLNKGDKDGSSG